MQCIEIRLKYEKSSFVHEKVSRTSFNFMNKMSSSTKSTTMKPLKIFFHSMDGIGHLNSCLGFAQALASRGHSIVFLLNASFKGQFEKFGFREILLFKTQSKQKVVENPINENAKMLLKSGLMNGKSSFEKLISGSGGQDDFARQQYDVSVEFNPQIERAIQEEAPDLIVLDVRYVPPSVIKAAAKIPWIYLFSYNPLALFNDERLPPPFSGYPTNGDRSNWTEFRQVGQEKIYSYYLKYGKMLLELFGCSLESADSLQIDETFLPSSKYLNIYGYPEELDYQDTIEIPDNFLRVDAFCRSVPEQFELPEKFLNRRSDQKLIYFSLGTVGSIDLALMKRIIRILAQTEHKMIVSKGPLADEYDLGEFGENCWGQSHLPQTQILPMVDVVITHGGNNTVTETFTYGKPMIVLPLFADQYDNAQRLQEKGFGIRLEPYTMSEVDLIGAVEKLLNDQDLNYKLKRISERIESSNSKEKACLRIEQLVQDFRK